ncbi:MAG: hypothetical protein P8013_03025 [Candidatus Sulfobium sp.]|jgi:hypothetical protein
MKKILFWLCSVACLSACAFSTRVPYQVSSATPGAQIYVNGISMGIAPIQIELRCDKVWRCPAGGSCSWELSDYVYEVAAQSSEDNSGLPQTKRVDPCQLKEGPGQIHFDVGSDAVASRPIDVNVNQNDKAISLDDTTRMLENSEDQGVLH